LGSGLLTLFAFVVPVLVILLVTPCSRRWPSCGGVPAVGWVPWGRVAATEIEEDPWTPIA